MLEIILVSATICFILMFRSARKIYRESMHYDIMRLSFNQMLLSGLLLSITIGVLIIYWVYLALNTTYPEDRAPIRYRKPPKTFEVYDSSAKSRNCFFFAFRCIYGYTYTIFIPTDLVWCVSLQNIRKNLHTTN